MSKSRTSLEQVINKLPTSNEQVMNKSQTSHEQCKNKWVWKDTNIDLVILYPHQPHFKVIILKSFLSLMFSWSFSKKPWHFFKCLVLVYCVIFLPIYTSAYFHRFQQNDTDHPCMCLYYCFLLIGITHTNELSTQTYAHNLMLEMTNAQSNTNI